MAKMECDKDMEIPIIDEYIKIMSEAEGKEVKVEYVERFEFYERAKKCYAVIATGFVLSMIMIDRETSQYANIILQKGVIKNPEYCYLCFILHVLSCMFSYLSNGIKTEIGFVFSSCRKPRLFLPAH